MSSKNYFDLTKNDVDSLKIEKSDVYNCVLKDNVGNYYDGFKLAESEKGKAYTVCDIDFHMSATDNKYQPRLIFRRTDKNYKTSRVRKDVIPKRIISFKRGQDGYREFWRMVAFLYEYKGLVDLGEFQDRYQVISDEEFTEYLNKKDELGELHKVKSQIDQVGINVAMALQSATTLKLLKQYKAKLEEFIKSKVNEKIVQNWLDEDKYKYRRERCMIFGLEFIKHKREGGVSGKRYDILTRIGSESEERILIELKGPSDDIFTIKELETINDKSSEYSLSPALSRAIPQILEYRKNLEEKRTGDPELENVDEQGEIKISKCVIVIGVDRKNNPRWRKNLQELRKSLSSNLEIWTYTDLVKKLESTIINLEQDTRKEEHKAVKENEDIPV